MEVETTKMSSKGQIVIPQDIREGLKANEGAVFAVVGSKDTIILKKIETPSKERLVRELASIAKEGKRRLQAKGLKEQDIQKLVQKSRRQ